MRFSFIEWMSEKPRPEPCPPHEWVDASHGDYALLQCSKDPNHVWPDRAPR